MELLGSGSGYKKYALGISSVGLLLTLACGAGAVPTAPLATNAAAVEPTAETAAGIEPPAGNEGILPESVLTEPAVSEDPPESADAEAVPVSINLGSSVGDRIPDFAITLVDGSTVTSAELLAQRQPTFLFFFETW